jgi:hypothetical protein
MSDESGEWPACWALDARNTWPPEIDMQDGLNGLPGSVFFNAGAVFGANGNETGGSGNMMMDVFLPMLMKQLMGPTATPAPNGMGQMVEMANSWGAIMKAMMQPVVEMQATMRQSVLNEMSTYSKTGGKLPWEDGYKPPEK